LRRFGWLFSQLAAGQHHHHAAPKTWCVDPSRLLVPHCAGNIFLQQNNQRNKIQHDSSDMTTPLLALLVWCVTTQVRSLLVVSKVIHLLLAMLAPQVSVSAAHSCMACHTVWWP
jgi:hypothetical protein